jgi:hypothetical protein
MKQAFFLLSILLLSTLARKEIHPDTHAEKKPRYLTGELYCNACQGMVGELLLKLRHRTKQSEIIDAMEDLCDMWKFAKYDYPPPEMKRGCEAILGQYSEDLERALMDRNMSDKDVETYFCFELTKACLEVWWEKIPGEGEFVPKNPHYPRKEEI